MPERFQFILSVWGADYIDLFSRAALPALMTSGNLLGFAPFQAELDIYTTQNDVATLGALPGLLALNGFVDVHVTAITLSDGALAQPSLRHRIMSSMHELAIRRAASKNAAMFFLAPDAVFANGTLEHARELLFDVKRLVLLPGTRSSTSMVDAVISAFNPRGRLGMEVAPRELVRLLMLHPHEQLWTREWGREKFAHWPSHVHFPVNGEGFVMRGFHHHPVAVFPERWDAEQIGTGTVDDSWLTNAVTDPATIRLITDTDDGFVVDVATKAEDETYGGRVFPDAERYLASWVLSNTDKRQREFARQSIFVHANPLTDEWSRVSARADGVIDRILTQAAALERQAAQSLQFI
jgi:hypothetical protein